MSEIIGMSLLAVGLLFDLFGCIGMVRLPDVYNRLQAGTKCVTLGTCLVLAGTAVMGEAAPIRLKSLLCLVFLLITSPTAAHALARAAHVSGVRLWSGSLVDQLADEEPKP